MTYNPGHNLLKQFRKTQHMLSRFFPSPSLVLVSHVCLGVNVFQINIEREGEENLASVSKILTGNVDVGVLGGNLYLGCHTIPRRKEWDCKRRRYICAYSDLSLLCDLLCGWSNSTISSGFSSLIAFKVLNVLSTGEMVLLTYSRIVWLTQHMV